MKMILIKKLSKIISKLKVLMKIWLQLKVVLLVKIILITLFKSHQKTNRKIFLLTQLFLQKIVSCH
jgi:hypothetical protein